MARTTQQAAEETGKSSADGDLGHAAGRVREERLGVRLKRYFRAQVSTEHADVLLLSCCLVSGLIDSNVFNGNTIFLGLGASSSNSSNPYAWAESLTSIACFVLGCLFFSSFSRVFGPLRRGTLVSSFLLQSVLIFVTAALVQTRVINGSVRTMDQQMDWKDEVAIALLAFQSAGQIVGSRTLSLSEIPTVVVTSVLCDMASDPKLISPLKSNAKRNRRILAFIGILVGAVVGGWIAKATKGMAASLWVAGGVKNILLILQSTTIIAHLLTWRRSPLAYEGLTET
ncbi:MAG: hypothetical protein M1830_008199 [Pleopsidium flavum]|nr:MAG: hypothetical protein M1830_008199 [Pleopsidium flavum]